jgi:hypothetical protein
MGRAPREFFGYGKQFEVMPQLKGDLADSVLLGVMLVAETYYVSIRRFESDAAVGACSDVRTFNRQRCASQHYTVMTPDPCPVGWAGSCLSRRPHGLNSRR